MLWGQKFCAKHQEVFLPVSRAVLLEMFNLKLGRTLLVVEFYSSSASVAWRAVASDGTNPRSSSSLSLLLLQLLVWMEPGNNGWRMEEEGLHELPGWLVGLVGIRDLAGSH